MQAIVIGLGGMGKETVARLRELIKEEGAEGLGVKFIGIDVDPNIPRGGLDHHITISLRDVSRQIEAFKKRGPEFTDWWIDNYNPFPPQNRIEGNTAANQIRIHGRLVFYNNLGTLRSELSQIIGQFEEQATLYIFIVSSLGGGTGSGIFIDTAALVRNLRPTAKIYGFFLDGTVTYKIVDSDVNKIKTLLNSYASLIELMHFLKSPDAYSMGGMKIPESFPRLFDICFIFQDKNKDEYTFVQNQILELKKSYSNLIANTIYPILGISQFEQSIIGNTFTNVFDNLDGSARELIFTSCAVGKITFSRSKIASYILTYLGEELLKDKPVAINPEFAQIEREKNINQREGSSLTSHVRQYSQSWLSLQEQIRTIEKKLMDNASDDKVLRDLPSRYPLIYRRDVLPSTLLQLYDEYRRDIHRILNQKIMEVKKVISEIIDEKKGGIESKRDWLLKAKGVIEKNMEYIDREKGKHNPQQTLNNLIEKWNGIFAVKGRGFFGPNRERTSRVQQYLEFYKKFIEDKAFMDVEYPLLYEFFKELKNFLDIKITTFDIIIWKIKRVGDWLSDLRGSLTWRDIPLDEFRLQNREYPLEVKIDVNEDIIEKYIKPKILEELQDKIDGYSSMLWMGKGLYNGIAYFIKDVEEKVIKEREKEVREDEFIEEQIKSFLNEVIKVEIENRLSEFSIQNMLEWWLGEILFPKVKYYIDNQRIEDLSRLAINWKSIFGDAANNLTDINNSIWRNPQNAKEQWVEEALGAYLKRLDEFVKPFIKYFEGENINRVRELTGDRISEDPYLKLVFCPLRSWEERVIKRLGWKSQEVSLPSTSVWIYSQVMRISPHTLKDYLEFEGHRIKDSYENHIRMASKSIEERRSLGDAPLHVDKRFYKEWRGTIGVTKPEEFTYWLVIVSLGTGIIERSTLRGRSKVFIYSGNKIADTLPQLVNLLKDPANGELREEIKERCKDKLEEIYITGNRRYEIVEDSVFKKAHEILEQLRGGPNPVWEEMKKMVEYRGDQRTSNNRVPQSWDELMELWKRI